MEYRKQADAVYYPGYYIVISTKYRRKILKSGVGEYVRKVVLQVSRVHPKIEILGLNTDVDHIHMFVSIPPKYSVCQVANMINSNTGRKLRAKFPHLDKVYWGVPCIWSIDYFVSTVGIKEATIPNYVRMQGEEDSGQA